MTLIPEGKYNAKAQRAEFGETNAGKPQVAVQFTITDGPFAGQSVVWYGGFGQAENKSTGEPIDISKRTLESLRYCGWEGCDVSDLSGVERNVVQVVLKHDTYQGQTKCKVSFVNRLGGPLMKTKLEGAKLAAFAAKIKGKAMSIPKDLSAPGVTPLPNGAGDHEPPGGDEFYDAF
jgi:hypothetical protein